jgi:hypothetical protein
MAEPRSLALIVGVPKIAAALNLTEHQVVNARRRGGLKFIWKEEGLGIVTSEWAAQEYMRRKAQLSEDLPELDSVPESPAPLADGHRPQNQPNDA